jgi:hypothetical protein
MAPGVVDSTGSSLSHGMHGKITTALQLAHPVFAHFSSMGVAACKKCLLLQIPAEFGYAIELGPKFRATRTKAFPTRAAHTFYSVP